MAVCVVLLLFLLVDGEVCSASARTWRLGGRGEGVGSKTLGADLIGSLIFFSMCRLVCSYVQDIVVCAVCSGLLAVG